MPITLNLQPELLQAIMALNLEQSIDAIVEQALRDYLQRHILAQSTLVFGESVLLFRKAHNLDQADFDLKSLL